MGVCIRLVYGGSTKYFVQNFIDNINYSILDVVDVSDQQRK